MGGEKKIKIMFFGWGAKLGEVKNNVKSTVYFDL